MWNWFSRPSASQRTKGSTSSGVTEDRGAARVGIGGTGGAALCDIVGARPGCVIMKAWKARKSSSVLIVPPVAGPAPVGPGVMPAPAVGFPAPFPSPVVIGAAPVPAFPPAFPLE